MTDGKLLYCHCAYAKVVPADVKQEVLRRLDASGRPFEAVPDLTMRKRDRTPVAGEVPSPINPPSGCAFHPRCPLANERCRREVPRLMDVGGAQVVCHALEEGRLPAWHAA